MSRRCGFCRHQPWGTDGAGGTGVQHAPGHPGRSSHIWLTPRLPWLVNKTPPKCLCKNINNLSYSLPNEKKLRTDRTGKCPVFLQACPNWNENNHLLTGQNGTLSGLAQAAPPLAQPQSHCLQTRGSLQVHLSLLRLCPCENLGHVQPHMQVLCDVT